MAAASTSKMIVMQDGKQRIKNASLIEQQLTQHHSIASLEGHGHEMAHSRHVTSQRTLGRPMEVATVEQANETQGDDIRQIKMPMPGPAEQLFNGSKSAFSPAMTPALQQAHPGVVSEKRGAEPLADKLLQLTNQACQSKVKSKSHLTHSIKGGMRKAIKSPSASGSQCTLQEPSAKAMPTSSKVKISQKFNKFE